jgi:hypothetical protein
MRSTHILSIILFLVVHSAFSQTWPDNLILTPERTNFKKTSTYAEVMTFLNAIDPLSDQVKVVSMGKSKEGNEIPLAVLSKDRVSTAEEAKRTGKLVIYIQGNIHAGEVEGKEAVMMLMRDILLGSKKHLLDNQIILFVPIYNTDSNDKMEKGRRPSQEDSPEEVGIRENSQGLDLNRDGIKQEAFETQALFSIINAWDPQVFVDLHTTNGTWHAYSLTWAPNYHYAGEEATYTYTNSVMLPAITKSMRDHYGLRLGPYGDYDLREGWPVRNFYTYNHHPRYLINQFSLRNRMAILSEAFAHERFYQRVHSTYSFVTEILEYTNQHAGEILSTNKKAEAEAIRKVREEAGKIKKGVRFKMVSHETIKDFITYDYVSSKKADSTLQWFRTGKIISVDEVNYFGQFEATLESTLPSGYIIPSEFSSVAEHLQKLGVKVERLTKSATFKGESFQAEKFSTAARKFEGHAMGSVEGKFVAATQKFKKGDYKVDLAQPLANLIFYMLEPQSDDGLVTWNFFDSYFQAPIANKTMVYPVFKYYIQ